MEGNRKKRILNVFVVVSTAATEPTVREMEKHVSPGFELHHANPKYGGMKSVEGLYYMAVATPYIVEEILKAEREGFDAALVNCFANPGAWEARELVQIPVIGAGEAALYVGLMLGSRLGVIEAGRTYGAGCHGAMHYVNDRWVKAFGLSQRVVSMRPIGLPVEDLPTRESTMAALTNVGQQCIQDGAEVLILGCTGMVGYADPLQRKLDVPVVDPSIASLKMAEMLLAMNLRQSKLTIPSPDLVGVTCAMKYPPTLTGYQPQPRTDGGC